MVDTVIPESEIEELLENASIGPGAKLLCIDDQGFRRKYVPGPPKKGNLYCVREVFVDGGKPGVLLLGIQGPLNAKGLECGFLLSRFRWVHD